MANKLNNLLKFTEYDHLQPKQKPTKKTEIGGFAVLEGISVKKLLKLAAEKTGKSKKELKNLSAKKLKQLAGIKKEKAEKPEKPEAEPKEAEGKENENILLEKKKPSAKQLAARKNFLEMISKKKGKKLEEKECGCKH
jgi:hypothetical protein